MSKLKFFIGCCMLSQLGWSQLIPFERYQVPTNQCYHLTTATGTHIFIEEGALIASDDSVDLYYREMNDPVDMILHDVPMHALWSSERVQLESSGMFEVYVLNGPDTLEIQSGKRLLVQMGSSSMPPVTSEAYRYDREADAWRSYPSPVSTQALADDSELWGSSPVTEELLMEAWDGDDVFGVSAGFSAYDSMRREIFQSMEITDFGFYNYDRILDGVSYQYIQADFSAGSRRVESTIYVVYDKINTVFYFPPETWESGFFLIKDRSYRLFSIGENGRVSVLTEAPQLFPTLDRYSFQLEGQSNRDTRTALAQILFSP